MAETNVTAPEHFEAAIDVATVERMEKSAQSQARGQQRRCALIAMARDSHMLSQLAKDEPDAFGDLADAVVDYYEFTKAQLEIAKAALARMAMAHALSEAA